MNINTLKYMRGLKSGRGSNMVIHICGIQIVAQFLDCSNRK